MSVLFRAHRPNDQLPRGYGLVYTDLCHARHYVAPIPLNLLIRWWLEIWMRIRNPLPLTRIDGLSVRVLWSEAYRQGIQAGKRARMPAGTALVLTKPTAAAVAAAWGVHADARELAERVLTAQINACPASRQPEVRF
jgi:hypothetical protein